MMILMMLFVWVSCDDNKNVETWLAYDPVDGYAFPSDTSKVVKQWKGEGEQIAITKHDSTDQWGCFVISDKLFSKMEVAWIPLDKLVFGGSNSPKDRLETFVVVPETLEMYNHPKGDKKDVKQVELSQNDTVQVTARSNSWVHVRKLYYHKTGHHTNRYGWVLENRLQKIDTMSYKELDDIAAVKAQKNDSAQMEERYSSLMAKSHPIYRKAATWIGWAALAMLAVFLAPAFVRSKFWNLILMLPAFILLKLVGEECIMPSWFMMFVIPIMAYVVTYPFLYFRTSLSYVWIYLSLSIAATAYYLLLYLNILNNGNLSLLWRILLFVVMLCVSVAETMFIYDRIERDICPYCGYFARHSKGSKRKTGSSVSYGTESRRVYDGRTHEIVGNTEYITDHYHDEKYQTETTTTNYETDRTCMRCGAQFVNMSSTSFTRRL